MPVIYKKKVAVLSAHCEIEEAENLYTWLNEVPSRQLNLKALESAHTAVFQVLIALKPKISVWPENERLSWLTQSLCDSNTKVWCK